MAKELTLDVFEGNKARLEKKYLCSLCGWEGDRMGITGMSKHNPEEYELGCPRCLIRWSDHRLIIMEEYDQKELAEALRDARAYRRNEKFKLLPEWEEDIRALEKILLRPSEQRGGNTQ
jgi:hypothetical protein